MNKLLLGSVGALCLSAFAGCAIDQPTESSSAKLSYEEFKARLGREPGTGAYIVDWDIVLHGEDELLEYWTSYSSGQALTINTAGGVQTKWSATQKKLLTYCIGAGFAGQKANIIAAMKAATEQGWEKFADVKFVYMAGEDANCTAANNNVLFDVNQVNSGGQYLARAFFPDDARANRNVLVDPASFDPAQTGNIPVANILIHELGHVLGFRHEHIRAPGDPCPEDLNFAPITNYDVVSTMHYPQCGSPGNLLSLSALDQQGAALVYGPPVVNVSPMATINAPLDGATVPRSFTVDAAVVDTDLVNATLSIDGLPYGTPLTTAPFTFEVTDLDVGTHTIEIKATDAIAQVTTRALTVTVQQGTGQGNGNGNGNGDDGAPEVTGGCSTAGSSGASLLVGLGLVGLVLRRRRR